MKALLVTTVEREKQTTMGQEPRSYNRIMVIPWKEIASIDVTSKEAGAVVHRIEDADLSISEFMPVDMATADSFQAIEDMREVVRKKDGNNAG